MGKVAAKIRVMPVSAETDLEELQKKIAGRVPEVKKFEREPIAFGLEALVLVALVDDSEGGTEGVEEALSALDGVESVQVVEVGRTF